jgi:hypothetical protein
MQLYQLRCECGTDIPVSRGQAGGEVTCASCGRRMPVPMLRELGQLPVAESEKGGRAGSRRWTVRQALISGGIVVALVSWGFAAWIVSATRMEYDLDRMRFEISRAPFARVYIAWKSLEMGGVERDETVGEYRAKNVDRVGKSSATTLAVIGGIGLLIALFGAVAVRDPLEGRSA